MTVALKSGGAGKAFSVITDELKRLSTSTIALTESITARGRELMMKPTRAFELMPVFFRMSPRNTGT